MAGHPLDNPVWYALGGPHAKFCLSHGAVRRYIGEVAIFAAVERLIPENLRDVATAIGDATVGFATAELPDVPDNLDVLRRADVQQMLGARTTLVEPSVPMAVLGSADVPKMMELVELTQPGPFAPRTIEMGLFLGIFEGERLAAMAGQRMRLDGYTEVSAVCTHPDFRGRQYAKVLMSAIIRDILDHGNTPFLHVFSDNDVAIRTYEKLGFTRRQLIQLTVVKRREAIA